MSITAGWDYCLGTAGVCQDSCAGCYTFSPFSITVKFQVIEPCRYPYNLHGITSDRGSYKVTHNAGNAGYPLWLLFSHWGNWRFRADVSMWWCTGLGEGQLGQRVAIFFTLLMSFLLVSVVQGFASASLPCSRSLSVVSWYWIDVVFLVLEGWSQEKPMSASWWHPFGSFFQSIHHMYPSYLHFSHIWISNSLPMLLKYLKLTQLLNIPITL